MDKKYRTNMAGEFYVLSVLYRNDIPAGLTPGHGKAVDILMM